MGGNYSAKETQNFHTKSMVICIQNFVQEQWLKQERVAAKSVFEFILI